MSIVFLREQNLSQVHFALMMDVNIVCYFTINIWLRYSNNPNCLFSQACGYYQKNSLTAKWWFNVGTDGCKGASECQFKTLEEAKKFCDHKPTCTAILRQEGSSNCDGGHGCFTPRKYDLKQNLDWKGKTYVKDCGGKISLLSLWSGLNILLSFNQH